MKCIYHFDDGTQSLETPLLTMSHTYKETGVYDNVTVECWNSISRYRSKINGTLVVDELENIIGLELKATKTFFGKETVINAAKNSGRYLTYHM